MASVDMINSFIQAQLKERDMNEIAAVEAARWLDEAGLLPDSQDRPGKPLRDLMRQEQIAGQRQELNGRWFIDRL